MADSVVTPRWPTPLPHPRKGERSGGSAHVRSGSLWKAFQQGMSFEFDPAKATVSLRKHGVSFAHAEQALRDPMAFTI